LELRKRWNFRESAFNFRRRLARRARVAKSAVAQRCGLSRSIEHGEVARFVRAGAARTSLKALSVRRREKDFRESAFLSALSLTRHLRAAQTRITE